MDKDSKKEKDMEIAHKRQQFQMHKKGYEDISNSINLLNKTIEKLLIKLDDILNINESFNIKK